MVRIIIIGGGPAGIAVAQTLAAKLTDKDNTEVLVLEKSKYYYHAVGTPRALVDAAFTKKLFIPYDNAISPLAKSIVKIQCAVATRIVAGANEIEYVPIGEDGEMLAGPVKSLSYDYLVIATGSTYTVPIKQPKNNFKRTTTEAKLAEVREQIKDANSVLIVGGGAVGIEVAGEIKVKYPNKTVTILEGRDKLVASDDVRDKFRTKMSRYLQRLGVKVVLGERLTERLYGNSFEKRTLHTDRGTEIVSDVQLLCCGMNPTTELIQKLDTSLISSDGFIKVNNKLQLDCDHYRNIYALGDVSNLPAPKRMYYAGLQGKHLGAELSLMVSKRQTKVSRAFPNVDVVGTMVPLGPSGGVSQLPILGGVVFGNLITRIIKSKDYFAGMAWKSLGAASS